jgi:hypothetical protein
MSREIVRQVNAQHPQLLQTNIGATCHQFTLRVIEALRAEGHQAFLVCKSPGEGQYVPPGFQPRSVVGLDGRTYQCSGVSHDAIWSDGQQFDTIGGANDNDRPIFRKSSDPGWSFDAADGPQITGTPVWNAIAPNFWRPNNPPLKEGAPTPTPVPPPTKLPSRPPSQPQAFPSYEECGGDAAGAAISRQLEADYQRAGRGGLDGDSGMWHQRVCYDFLTRKVPTVQDAIAKHRKSWCDALGIPVQ